MFSSSVPRSPVLPVRLLTMIVWGAAGAVLSGACSSSASGGASGTVDSGQQQAQHACVFEKRLLGCDGHVGDWQRICVDGDCTAAYHSDNCQPIITDPMCIDNWDCRNMSPIDTSCADWESHARPMDAGVPVGPGTDAGVDGGGALRDAGGPSSPDAGHDGGPSPSDGGPSASD